MNQKKILSILGNIIENDINNYPLTSPLNKFEFDSIRFIQFVVAIEEEFNIEIHDSDLLFTNFETIEMIFTTLEKYFNASVYKKVIICDCDNVLWQGIAGEEKIYINEKTITLQKKLIDLYNKGILICLCSKNEKINIDNAFEILDMPLNLDHVIISKVDYNDKIKNIKSISYDLNLSLDSFVFADDSDYEIGLVNSLLPEVETVKVNYDNLSFIDDINRYFETYQLDINRTQLYKDQKEREKEKLRFNSVEEYNNSLKTKITCAFATNEQAERISELSQRTNQFNLSGSRYSTNEVKDFVSNSSYGVIYLTVSDKYGDMGIVGAAIFKSINELVVIENFYLSCRVFGRGFEYFIIDMIKNINNNKIIYGIYKETNKNQRYSEFYEKNEIINYVE